MAVKKLWPSDADVVAINGAKVIGVRQKNIVKLTCCPCVSHMIEVLMCRSHEICSNTDTHIRVVTEYGSSGLYTIQLSHYRIIQLSFYYIRLEPVFFKARLLEYLS